MNEEIWEAFRNSSIFIYFSLILLFCFIRSTAQIDDHIELEIKAYRLQQFDIVNTQRGSRSSKVMYEAVSLNTMALRRCLLINWKELISRDLNSLFSYAVGSVLIIMPIDFDDLSPENYEALTKLDRNLYDVNTDMAIYITKDNPEISALQREVSMFSEKSMSATRQLLNVLSASTYQLFSTSSNPISLIDMNSLNIVGQLWATDRSSPTIVIVAHYDSHSSVPLLSKGSDSNGSGVVALLEIMAILSPFYKSAHSRPLYNMIFLLSAGGKFNYQGARQWIEDHIEKQSEHSIQLVICLDTIGGGSGLTLHVSKMPHESSPIDKMYKYIMEVSSKLRSVNIVSKKINLNAELLSWEHERFSIKRLSAFTISRLSSSNEHSRTSLLDTPGKLDLSALEANINAIAEALLAYIFVLPTLNCTVHNSTSLYSVLNHGETRSRRIKHWVNEYASTPRPLASQNSRLTASLKDTVARYTTGNVAIEPVPLVDLSLYGLLEDRIIAHRVKPAIFELILAVLISSYLFGIYLVALNIHSFTERALRKLKLNSKLKRF